MIPVRLALLLMAALAASLPLAARAVPARPSLPTGVSVDGSSLAFLAQPGTFDDLHDLGISILRLPIEEYPVDRLDAHRRTAEVRNTLIHIAREARRRSLPLIGVIGPQSILWLEETPIDLSDARTRAQIIHATIDAAQIYNLHAVEVWPQAITGPVRDGPGNYAQLIIELRTALDATSPEVKIILPWMPGAFDASSARLFRESVEQARRRLPFDAIIIHAPTDAPLDWPLVRLAFDFWIADLAPQANIPVLLHHSIPALPARLAQHQQAQALAAQFHELQHSPTPPALHLYAHYLDPEPRESDESPAPSAPGLRATSLDFYHRKPVWHVFSDIAHAREPSLDLLQIHGTRRLYDPDSEGAP